MMQSSQSIAILNILGEQNILAGRLLQLNYRSVEYINKKSILFNEFNENNMSIIFGEVK